MSVPLHVQRDVLALLSCMGQEETLVNRLECVVSLCMHAGAVFSLPSLSPRPQTYRRQLDVNRQHGSCFGGVVDGVGGCDPVRGFVESWKRKLKAHRIEMTLVRLTRIQIFMKQVLFFCRRLCFAFKRGLADGRKSLWKQNPKARF